MVVRMLALGASCPLPPGRFVVLISVRGWVDPRAIVWLEVSGQLKRIQWPHRELNQRPSGLQHNVLTNYATAFITTKKVKIEFVDSNDAIIHVILWFNHIWENQSNNWDLDRGQTEWIWDKIKFVWQIVVYTQHQIHQTVSEMKHADKWTYTFSPWYVHFIFTVQTIQKLILTSGD
jgi:hypothetical protein